MKKQILFSTALFFSVIVGMDEPAKGKLLFPFPGKTAKDVWAMVRENHIAHHYFLESELFMLLPYEVSQMIQRLWFAVCNPPSFSTSQDQFFRKLLSSCIMLSCKEKEWKFPLFTKATEDGGYYVYDEMPNGNNTIKVYDRATKKTIEITCDYYPQCNMLQEELLRKKNVIIFVRGGEFLLYDIQKSKEYCYRDIFSLSCNGKFWVSENERYVCVRDEESYCVLDITRLDDIKRYPFDIGDETIEAVTFSSDNNYFACSLKNQTVGLWAINKNGLVKQAICDAAVWQSSNIHFTHNNEYLVGSVIYNPSYIQTIKVEKNEEGSVSLKRSFYAGYRMWGMFKDVLIVDDSATRLMILDGAGQIRHTFQELWHRCNSKRSPKHVFQDNSDDQKKIIISRLLHDEKGYYCGVQQDTVISNDMGVVANKHETMMQSADGGCYSRYTDLNGRLLWHAPRGFYSEFGFDDNVVLQASDKCCKKLTLHPRGAEEHLKILAHKPLTLAQYASLENVCAIAEKVCATAEKYKLSLMQKIATEQSAS